MRKVWKAIALIAAAALLVGATPLAGAGGETYSVLTEPALEGEFGDGVSGNSAVVRENVYYVPATGEKFKTQPPLEAGKSFYQPARIVEYANGQVAYGEYYAQLSDFSSGGYALACNFSGKYGVLDRAGRVVIVFGKYKELYGLSDDGHIIAVNSAKKRFLIDLATMESSLITEKEAGYISSGYYVAAAQNGVYEYRTPGGGNLFNRTFSYAEDFLNGYAVVRPGDSDRFEIIDTSGRTLLSVPSGCRPGPVSEEGIFSVTDANGLTGYMDLKGEMVVPCVYESGRMFRNGFAVVSAPGKGVGLIDLNGGEVIPCGAFRSLSDASDTGLVWAGTDGGGKAVLKARRGEAGSPQGAETRQAGYYQPAERRLFRVRGWDDSGEVRGCFTVTVDGRTFTSGKDAYSGTDDITAEVPANFVGDVAITKAGYHTLRLPAELTGEYNLVVLYPETVTAPFAQTLLLGDPDSGRFQELLLTGGGIYNEEMFSLYPMVNWNGHGEGVIWLEQGDQKIPLTNNAFNEVSPAKVFSPGEPICLCGVAADGSSFRQETKLAVYRDVRDSVSLDLGERVTADVGTSGVLGLFAGNSLTFDLDGCSVPISFTVRDDAGVEGVIGLDAAAFGRVKDALTRLANGPQRSEETEKLLLELEKTYGPIADFAAELGVKGRARVLGYFTGSLEGEKLRMDDIKTVLAFSGTSGYTYDTTILTAPASFQAALTSEVQWLLEMACDGETLRPDGGRLIDGDLITVTARPAPGWEGCLSGVARGSARVGLEARMPLSVQGTSLRIEGSIYFTGTLYGISGRWTLADFGDGEVIWENGEPCRRSAEDRVNLFSLTSPAPVSSMAFVGTPDFLAAGVNGYTAPVLAELSDGRLLAVWTAKVPGRAASDRMGLYYSVFTDGSWTDPALIADDGTNDSAPRLYTEDERVGVAWENYSEALNTDAAPDLDTARARLTYVSSAFDGEKWSRPVPIGREEYYAAPQLPADFPGERPPACRVLAGDAVVYLSPDDNGEEQVYGVFKSGGAWGRPVPLTDIEGGVNGFDAVMGDGTITILYTNGELSGSDLNLLEIPVEPRLEIAGADYIRETLVPGGSLTVSALIRNDGPVGVDSARVTVSLGERELFSGTVPASLPSGGADVVLVDCPLPERLDFDELEITIEPAAGAGSDTASIAVHRADLSVENVSATVTGGGAVRVLTQVVNRGQTLLAATTLTYRKGSSEGPILGSSQVPVLGIGQLVNVSAELEGLEAGEPVYVEAAILEGENIIGNNSSHAIPVELKPGALETGKVPPVRLNSAENGSLELTPRDAGTGSRVTVTMTPKAGYDAGELTVTDSAGAAVTAEENGDGTYSFTVPVGGATVTGTFVKCTSREFADLNTDAWYHKYTDFVIAENLMRGMGGDIFDPEGSVTRAQFVMTLWNLEGNPEVTGGIRFSDVKDGQWFTEAIRWAASQDIVAGYPDKTFKPNQAITRDEMVAMLYRYERKKSGGLEEGWSCEFTFSDREKIGDWCREAVAWSVMNNIIVGKNGSFDPYGTARRNELAVVLTKYVELMDK